MGNRTIRFVFIDMWFMILSGPFKRVAHHLNERLFIGACLFANVIFVGTFQVWIGNLIHFLFVSKPQIYSFVCVLEFFTTRFLLDY